MNGLIYTYNKSGNIATHMHVFRFVWDNEVPELLFIPSPGSECS